jgi:hypothetical protein
VFDGKEQALAHQDTVLEVFKEGLADHVDAFQISPILDGAKVKVAGADESTVQETFEDAGFPVQMIGEGPDGDWFEMKVKPQNDG